MSEDKPHSICHLYMSREFGGLEKHVMELAAWQSSQLGERVSIIAHPRYETLCPSGVKFIPFNTDRSRRNPLLLASLLRLLKSYNFELLHCHGGKPAQVLLGLKSLIRSRVVITRHNISHPNDRVAAHFSERIAVSAAAVANSKLEWSIIPNGTFVPDMGQSCPEVRDKNQKMVLAVARFVPAKGLDLLLKAWAKVNPRDAKLYLLGDGPERQKLETLASELNIQNRVCFVGYSNNVNAWMQSADFMVVSSHKEGAPYTVVEALLNKCPVISTDVGCNRELLPEGFVTDQVSSTSIARLLEAALQSSEELRSHYEPAFDYASNHLTLAAMVDSTSGVYERAFSARAA